MTQLSLDLDESLSSALLQQSAGNALSSSPPSGRTSPPIPTTPQLLTNHEPLELQIDYWPIIKPGDKAQSKSTDQSKNSIKSTFRNLQVISEIVFFFGSMFHYLILHQVYRLPLYPQAGDASHGLIINYATKEKKQKSMRSSTNVLCPFFHKSLIFILVMRLGKKKEKDREMEKQCIDGIARLICSPKQSHPVPLRGK